MTGSSALMRAPATNTPTSTFNRLVPARISVIQRACACGGSAGVAGKCEHCDNEERLGRSSLQPKISVSSPNDPYEQEADRVADAVMRMPGPGVLPLGITPLIQREGASALDEEDNLIGTLQREAAGQDTIAEDEEELQRDATSGGTFHGTGGLAASLRTPATGAPLPLAARGFFESRLGRGLDRVRIHSDADASTMARSISARAFTHGPHIYFSAGQYDPGSVAGRRLLAHELTHVFQQNGDRTLRRKASPALSAETTVQLPMDGPANRNEVAAERAAATVGDTASAGADAPSPAGSTAPSDGTVDLPASFAGAIARPSGGTALPLRLRIESEGRLGTSLAHVRIHQDSSAIALARALDARAFTYGADIWLGEGESLADRRLMAHELTHVAQQSPRPLAVDAPAAAAVGSRLQATKRWYYALPALGRGSKSSGDRTHDLILPILGKERSNDGLFSEVPIPEGAAGGSTGRADLVRTDTGALFGVKFELGQPSFRSLHARTLRNGTKASEATHVKTAAPAGNTLIAGAKACKDAGLPLGQGICRVDQGPKTVMIADLKPNYEAEILLGTPQVDRYISKVDELGTKVNTFNPALIHPSGATWTVSARRLRSDEITIPSEFENPTAASNRKVEANLFVNGEQTPITDITALNIAKHSNGFLTYEFIPVNQLGTGTGGAAGAAPARPGGGIGDAKSKLKDVKEALKEEPKRVSSARRRAEARQRLALKPGKKLEAKDNFKFSDWNTTRYRPWETIAKAATGGEGKKALKAPTKEAEQRMRDEAMRQINARVKKASTTAPPPDTAARTRELDVVQHWIDHGEVYGRLRDFFGSAYVKVVKAYDSVKAKIEAKIEAAKHRMRRATGGSSGIKGAVLGAIRSIASSLLGLLIRDVANKLMAAVQKGATVLLGTLFGEEVDQIEEQLKAIERSKEDLEAFIRQTIEEKFKTQLDTLEAKIREIESVAATMRDIGTLINIVKWAYRIAQCSAPPLLGCLIGLIGSAIAEAILAAIVASCWFQREVAYPLVRALGPVRALPTVVAKTIADRVRDLLPESLKPLMGEVDTSDLVSTPSDIDCDSTSSYNNMDANQRKLAEMLRDYDPDHVDALLKALEHLGVAKNPPDPNDKLEGAEIDALKKLLDKYSKSQLDDFVAKTPVQQPKQGGSGKFLADLDQAVGKQSGGQQQGQAPAAGVGVGGQQAATGGGTLPTAEEVAQEGAEVAKRLKETTIKPDPGQRRFAVRKDKAGHMLRSDGNAVAKGDSFKTLFVARIANGTVIGGLQTITVSEVTDEKMTITVHAGTRFYTVDGTYVETSTEETSVVFAGVPK